MRTRFFTFFPLLMALVCGEASAQTNSTSTGNDASQSVQPSATTAADPTKVADFEKRFAHGQELEQAGKLAEARAVFDGIIAESPEAKGSLREAGLISLRLNDLSKANDYLEKLHTLVPDYPAAIELLIQINQTLGRDVKVETLLKEFHDLHDSGKVPDFSKSLWFVREHIHQDQQDIVVSQSFDYTKDPNTVWMAEVFDANGQLKRRLLLNYDPNANAALQAKDPNKYAHTQVFVWLEHVMKDGKPKEIDYYLNIFALPDYKKFRSAMLTILANPPKPIYSQAIDASSP